MQGMYFDLKNVQLLKFNVSVLYAGAKEFCHNEEFTAECPGGDVILVTSAMYGRMTVGRCVKTDFGNVNCFADVITHAHESCSGRPSCSIRVPDAALDEYSPCNQDLKSYLEITYICIKGEPAPCPYTGAL